MADATDSKSVGGNFVRVQVPPPAFPRITADRIGISIQSKEVFMEIVLRNLTEDYVMLVYNEIASTLDCCKCDHCRLDMISYSLNRLKPRYVVSSEGELMTKLCEFDYQFETTVMSELAKAAKVVKAKPRHKIPQDVK